MSKRAIKVDSWVRTADGAEGRVTYISPDGEAQIYPKDGGDYLNLPVSELRHTTELTRPPIQGMPTERPTCPFCNKPLKPGVRDERTLKPYKIVSRTFTGWNGYEIIRGSASEKFCTLRCARDFANAAYRAGYRIVRKDKTGG